MSAARRSPRTVTAAVAACAVSLASAAPAVARPAGHGPARPCVGCATRDATGVRTSSLAGTVDPHAGAAPAARPVEIAAPDGGGATTLAVVLIAGGALLAGGGAGFAGARRVTLPTAR